MSFSININKAKELYLTKVREKRNELFPDLDVKFMKALEQGNSTLAAEIGAKKEILRNIPNEDLSHITTLSELKSMWNEEILGDSPYK